LQHDERGADWDDGTLEVAGELATTMMACPDGLQEQEDWLAALLTSSPAIALDGDTLIVGDDTNGMVLEERANLPLEGTVWQLEAHVDSAVSAVAAGIAGLTIDASGTQVQVAAGCNTGSGSVTVEPADDASTGTIDFDPLAMTRKACPEDAMSVEAQVLTVLDGPVDYSIDGST
jgi:heat shock protein HslJ